MLPVFLLDALRGAKFAEKDTRPFLPSHSEGGIKISTRIFEKHDCPKWVTLAGKVEIWFEKEKYPQTHIINVDKSRLTWWKARAHYGKKLLCPILCNFPKTKIILSLVGKKHKILHTQKKGIKKIKKLFSELHGSVHSPFFKNKPWTEDIQVSVVLFINPNVLEHALSQIS